MTDPALVSAPDPKPAGAWRLTGLDQAQMVRWARRWRLPRRLAIALTLAAISSGIVTFVTLSGSSGITNDPNFVLALLVLDSALLLALGGTVVWRVAKLWAERRAGAAGSRLHVRLASMFAVLAVAPSIVLVILGAIFFALEVQAWFSERVRTAVDESVAVAEAYLREHKQGIASDAFAMANDLYRQWPTLYADPRRLDRAVEAQSRLRALNEVVLFEEGGRPLASAGLSLSLRFETPPEWALREASAGELVVLASGGDDRIRALVGLQTVPQTFLFVGRFVDPAVLRHIDLTRSAAAVYEQLESRRYGLQATFALVFVLVAMLLVLAAVGVGLNYATRLARPISSLVTAAERVRAGDFTARVVEEPEEDELGTLTRAFNRMTGQLAQNQRELIEANRQLDGRRRFTEAVLAGVSSGVIGLDGTTRIHLPNRSASFLLSTSLDRLIGKRLDEAVPEMAHLIEAAVKRPSQTNEAQLAIERKGRSRTLLARVTAERSPDGGIRGFVVTFDDITDLLAAQRTAAWADIARRIAHEIKNPLTPIQLSAERLKRKYLGEVKSDPQTFEMCTDTIIRQVSGIGRMVDEFSNFARMPAPVLRRGGVAQLCRDAVALQRTAAPDIRYELDLPDGHIAIRCDAELVTQALTNLLKNAAEAIEARNPCSDNAPLEQGCVVVRVAHDRQDVRIIVEDNGRGLPISERTRLTEPYVTTRAKGTGLGLAIVKKIMEDHGGDLLLGARRGGGACVQLLFAKAGATGGSAASDRGGTDGA